MDKKIANNLIVGVFVIAGTITFLFILFTIGEGAGILSRTDSLFGKFTHVKGLNYGSEVALAGLRVGTVKKISIDNTNSKLLIVELSINRDMMDKIRQDSVAMIKTSGVLGDKYIEISIGSPEQPAIRPNSSITTEEPEDIFTKSGSLVKNISDEFRRGGEINELIRNLNRVALNLAQITGEMKQQKGLLHELVAGSSGVKLSQTMDHFEEISRKINNGTGSLGALINDPTVYEDLKLMMGGAKRSSVLKYFMQSFIKSGAEDQQTSGKR